ncbi:uncharacterized protein ALTATR162_LOCUS3959 [Alternaria atra]|uniref:non-specific serine/threonine protein kinase n=1 Tax=Alternaria atra TaxID=119953 RepID=A0A8J2HXH5_9PLEO|nr:uncharacterized protein ALTATR162_LOCUS3959 [Alternaria atra]CAG5156047.1 unnamed protein product [Alternaria atra]
MKASKRLEAEIANLAIVRQHEHIAGMLAWSYIPVGPAIFLPFCELGDLNQYVLNWKFEQGKQGKVIKRISEVTIWKFLHDMALALDYLHNKHENYGYTHNDIKPDNILVDLPSGWKSEDGIPDEPVFKLTDFARMTRYNPSERAQPTQFCGTPEYAPLFSERGELRPSADIWALGGTLQTLALGVYPIQSREAFSAGRHEEKQPAPFLVDEGAWKKSHWRHLIPPTFRPLSATQEELRDHFDVRESIVINEFYPNCPWEHKPYSRRLDGWYEWMFEVDEKKRITARMLVRYCVPRIARMICVTREEEKAEECFERAKALRKEVERKQQSRVVAAEGMAFGVANVPRDEGKDYHAIEAE